MVGYPSSHSSPTQRSCGGGGGGGAGCPPRGPPPGSLFLPRSGRGVGAGGSSPSPGLLPSFSPASFPPPRPFPPLLSRPPACLPVSPFRPASLFLSGSSFLGSLSPCGSLLSLLLLGSLSPLPFVRVFFSCGFSFCCACRAGYSCRAAPPPFSPFPPLLAPPAAPAHRFLASVGTPCFGSTPAWKRGLLPRDSARHAPLSVRIIRIVPDPATPDDRGPLPGPVPRRTRRSGAPNSKRSRASYRRRPVLPPGSHESRTRASPPARNPAHDRTSRSHPTRDGTGA